MEHDCDEILAESRAVPLTQVLYREALDRANGWAPGGKRSAFYGRDGSPISLEQYEALAANGPTHLAEDLVGRYRVSTIWLGADHSFGFGPPLIFETMVFAGAGLEDEYQDRYWSEEAALAGHLRVVAALRAGVDPKLIDLEELREIGEGNGR